LRRAWRDSKLGEPGKSTEGAGKINGNGNSSSSSNNNNSFFEGHIMHFSPSIDEKEKKELVSLCRQGGGSHRATNIRGSTHFVAKGSWLDQADTDLVKSCDRTPEVVSVEWLRESARRGCAVPLDEYRVALFDSSSSQQSSIVVSLGGGGLSRGDSSMSLMRKSTSRIVTAAAEKLSSSSTSALNAGSKLKEGRGSSQQEGVKGGGNVDTGGGGGGGGKGKEGGGERETSQKERIFEGYSLWIDPDVKEAQELGKKVVDAGGKLTISAQGAGGSVPDFQVKPLNTDPSAAGGLWAGGFGARPQSRVGNRGAKGSIVASDYWLRKCMALGKLIPVKGTPACQPVGKGRLPIKGAGVNCFCATGLVADKSLVRWLCAEMGLNFPSENRMKQKATTHLIAGENAPGSEKADKAREWGIPTVSISWLEACAAKGEMLPCDSNPGATADADTPAGTGQVGGAEACKSPPRTSKGTAKSPRGVRGGAMGGVKSPGGGSDKVVVEPVFAAFGARGKLDVEGGGVKGKGGEVGNFFSSSSQQAGSRKGSQSSQKVERAFKKATPPQKFVPSTLAEGVNFFVGSALKGADSQSSNVKEEAGERGAGGDDESERGGPEEEILPRGGDGGRGGGGGGGGDGVGDDNGGFDVQGVIEGKGGVQDQAPSSGRKRRGIAGEKAQQKPHPSSSGRKRRGAAAEKAQQKQQLGSYAEGDAVDDAVQTDGEVTCTAAYDDLATRPRRLFDQPDDDEAREQQVMIEPAAQTPVDKKKGGKGRGGGGEERRGGGVMTTTGGGEGDGGKDGVDGGGSKGGAGVSLALLEDLIRQVRIFDHKSGKSNVERYSGGVIPVGLWGTMI
jgi:hypothetical protein